jgi:phosphohistidine phosphatase
MELYLLRHGTAERGKDGASDSERSLTEKGEHEIRRVTSAAKLGNMCPSLILASPYRRAMQTAKIAADVLDYKDAVLTTDALLPEGDVHAMWDEIRLHRNQGCLLLCGHEPLFSASAAYLLGCPELLVDFPKAGLMRIDLEAFANEPRGVLKWMLAYYLTV